jgi:oxygen-independent coproporphyrinogen-3 oxidase
MAGIYVHIPFCRKACYYCNFHFSTSAKNINEMVEAICIEAELRYNYLNKEVSTIYFGGGTPSLLSADQLYSIVDKLNQTFHLTNDTEVTLETNPDDINLEKLALWKSIGINRLSIGVQSFFEEDLQWMNRAHNASQAQESIELAQQAGFANITIDLIYGTPTLTDEKWQKNVHQALSLNVPHLSCYALTVEPKTALEKMILQQKKENVDSDKQSRQFELLMEWLNEAEYEHYEISNFAKPGYRSKHNSSYWQNKTYLGLGPSAHSYNRISRQWNVSNNAIYTKSLQQNVLPFEMENLTSTQQLNEYIMTSLRTIEGISLPYISSCWNENMSNNILRDAERWIRKHQMQHNNNHLCLTNQGKLYADGIAAELFR